MAPTFRHGKNSRLVVSSVDASSLFTEMTIAHSVDAPDVTTFGNNDRNYVAGQRDATISASGLLEGSTAGTGDPFAKFRGALGSTSDLVITAIPGGPGGSTVTAGSLCRLGAGTLTSFETAAPAMGVVTASFEAQCDGRLGVGRTLYGPGGAKTSTFAGTSVDSGVAAGTAGGGIAHFHITAASTVTSVTIKVQHSSAGASWTDVATFTSTSTGSQRTIYSSSVKRYTRAAITAFTGGASKSIRYVVAFSRNQTAV
jgi:hypothetical protein